MKHKSIDEIKTLVMECRSSGLSDYQWCKANSLSPSTLYRWVQRLKSTNCDILESKNGKTSLPSCQEVVKLEVIPSPSEKVEYNTPISTSCSIFQNPVMEISTGSYTVRVSNDVEPELFRTALICLGGVSSC